MSHRSTDIASKHFHSLSFRQSNWPTYKHTRDYAVFKSCTEQIYDQQKTWTWEGKVLRTLVWKEVW